ncbi:hypothetical protein [Spirosoma utsteinense]|uniref:DUF5683 domain-containing protein n=1 Tax=Spirosoma utsteinense TaxID=2585773 RepID=A0ABR6W838_9BACT|nr:hypothetical protein [Spirosoma utsteinense]MBC3786124.1 hypothetical protein [Spirosoma utsteinense]MBC3792313.1 hypothetical protein [Spirosoma utsteinense]
MRALTLMVGLFASTLTYAQDTITLRNGDQIPAKVPEVGRQELTYRKSANLEGPVYTAPIQDVLLINYANGTKDVFEPGRAPSADGMNLRNRMDRRLLPGQQRGMFGTANPPVALDRLRYQSRLLNRHFVDANGQRVDMAQAENLLRLKPDAMAAFDRGRSLRTWAFITAGSAVALVGAGAGLALSDHGGRGAGRFGGRPDRLGQFGINNDPMNQTDRRRGHDQAVVGAALAGSGIVLGLTSVWLSHRATVQFRRAANRYTNASATSFRLSPASQGLGLSLTMGL